jgi:hypothetical protein
VNSPIRTSAIGLLQHLQLLYLPSELDIDEQNTTSYLTFYCMQYHPVIPTLTKTTPARSLFQMPATISRIKGEESLSMLQMAILGLHTGQIRRSPAHHWSGVGGRFGRKCQPSVHGNTPDGTYSIVYVG